MAHIFKKTSTYAQRVRNVPILGEGLTEAVYVLSVIQMSFHSFI